MNAVASVIHSCRCYILSNACFKSAKMSSMCSVSIDRRMVDGLMCWASSSSGDNCEWVVVENLLIFAFYTLFFISVFNSKRCHLFADAKFLFANKKSEIRDLSSYSSVFYKIPPKAKSVFGGQNGDCIFTKKHIKSTKMHFF